MSYFHAYRVTRWVSLTGDFDRLRYRRLLSVMSQAEVSYHWLEKRSGLSRAALQAFLDALDGAGVLVKVPLKAGDDASVGSKKSMPIEPASLRSALRRLGAWAARPVRLQGRGIGLRVVIGDQPVGGVRTFPSDNLVSVGLTAASLNSAAPGPFSHLSSNELLLIRRHLATLLPRHAPTRRAAMHLKVVEHTLRCKGAPIADTLPRPLLVLALVQLDALKRHASAAEATDLDGLRNCLLAAISRTRLPRVQASPLDQATDFDERQLPETGEAPVTDFLACQAAWDATPPTIQDPPDTVARVRDSGTDSIIP